MAREKIKADILIPVEDWEWYKGQVLSTWFIADEPKLTRHLSGVSDSDFENLSGYYTYCSERNPDDYVCASFESDDIADLHIMLSIMPSGGFLKSPELFSHMGVPDTFECEWLRID